MNAVTIELQHWNAMKRYGEFTINGVVERIALEIVDDLRGLHVYLCVDDDDDYQICDRETISDMYIKSRVNTIAYLTKRPPCVSISIPQTVEVICRSGVQLRAVITHVSAPGTRVYTVVTEVPLTVRANECKSEYTFRHERKKRR